MKRILLGMIIGLFLGWATVPIVRATYSVAQSGRTVVSEDDDFRSSHAYKWFLQQMLLHISSIDKKLTELNDNIKAVKEKLHA